MVLSVLGELNLRQYDAGWQLKLVAVMIFISTKDCNPGESNE
jgi:hypothetical protein